MVVFVLNLLLLEGGWGGGRSASPLLRTSKYYSSSTKSYAYANTRYCSGTTSHYSCFILLFHTTLTLEKIMLVCRRFLITLPLTSFTNVLMASTFQLLRCPTSITSFPCHNNPPPSFLRSTPLPPSKHPPPPPPSQNGGDHPA